MTLVYLSPSLRLPRQRPTSSRGTRLACTARLRWARPPHPFLFSLLFRHAGGVASHPAVVPDPTSVSLHPARTLRLHLLGPHAGLHSSEMQARAKSDSPHSELGGKAGLWGGKATEGASQSQSEGE